MPPPINPAFIADVLQELIDVGCECLEATTLGRPADCFTSWCEPPDDCCDFLAAYPTLIQPTTGFTNEVGEFDRITGRCGDISGRLEIRLKLMRPCWPTLVDNATAPFPPAADIQQASEELFVDMRVLWCCILSEYSAGNLWSLTGDEFGCLDVGWGPMIPKCPEGGCVGLYWDISLELPTCCDEEP